VLSSRRLAYSLVVRERYCRSAHSRWIEPVSRR